MALAFRLIPGAWVLGALLAFQVPVAAQMLDPAARAYSERDYQTAHALWQEAAEAGSPEAMLRLGQLYDYGQGRPRDYQTAFKWYLEAAQRGMAEAQFNVAVMLDGGTGTARDPSKALIWYSRAALRGQPRAQYNLGLLFENGFGTGRNSDLARFWFGQAAASVPAAAQRLKEVREPTGLDGVWEAPNIVFADSGNETLEMIWSSLPAPGPSNYLVEVEELSDMANLPSNGFFSLRTKASGILTTLPRSSDPVIWRVSQIDQTTPDYTTSGWQNLPQHVRAPLGHVTLVFDATGAEAEAFVGLLRNDLEMAGLNVDLAPQPQPEPGVWADPSESMVLHAYQSDADLARSIAGLLPGISADTVLLAPDPSAHPGDITIRLVLAEG